LIDCSKAQSKISAFVSVAQNSDNCDDVLLANKTEQMLTFEQETVSSFGMKPNAKIEDWSISDLSNQLPVRQRLEPVWLLFRNSSLKTIDSSFNSEDFLSWIRPMYANLCKIMNYNCQFGNPCPKPKRCAANSCISTSVCNHGEVCVRRYFPTSEQKNYVCKSKGPQIHWENVLVRNSS